MNISVNTQVDNLTQFAQSILLNEQGFIIESCDTIFSTQNLLNKPIYEAAPFLESIFPSLLILTPDTPPIHFNKVEMPARFLPGYYDFTFSKVHLNDTDGILWCVFDYTDLYIDLMRYQQQKNELEIHRQLFELQNQSLQHSSDIKRNKNFFYPYLNTNSSKGFSVKIQELLLSKDNVLDLFSTIQQNGTSTIHSIDTINANLEEFTYIKKEFDLFFERNNTHFDKIKPLQLDQILYEANAMVEKHFNVIPTVDLNKEEDTNWDNIAGKPYLIRQVIYNLIMNSFEQNIVSPINIYTSIVDSAMQPSLKIIFSQPIKKFLHSPISRPSRLTFRISLVKKLVDLYGGKIFPLYDLASPILRISFQLPCYTQI